jgi:hypothetical protein
MEFQDFHRHHPPPMMDTAHEATKQKRETRPVPHFAHCHLCLPFSKSGCTLRNRSAKPDTPLDHIDLSLQDQAFSTRIADLGKVQVLHQHGQDPLCRGSGAHDRKRYHSRIYRDLPEKAGTSTSGQMIVITGYDR